MPAATLRALLSGLVDYAGLFPPASLTLEAVAHNYADYLRGPYAWMLGRLIIPAARVRELAALTFEPNATGPWSLSVLCADTEAEDLEAVVALNGSASRLHVDSVEFRFASIEHAHDLRRSLPANVELYAEVPLGIDLAELQQLNALEVRAKIRTGGIVESAFPGAAAIAAFLQRAAGIVPFKLTAGLHHPVRSRHNLTYASDGPSGVMHGFLNAFVAAGFAYNGHSEIAERILLEEDAGAFSFTDESIRWEQQSISFDEVRNARKHFARSFGSCSFTEPVHDLTTLGLL